MKDYYQSYGNKNYKSSYDKLENLDEVDRQLERCTTKIEEEIKI